MAADFEDFELLQLLLLASFDVACLSCWMVVRGILALMVICVEVLGCCFAEIISVIPSLQLDFGEVWFDRGVGRNEEAGEDKF